MKTKILITIFVLLIGGVTYFAYPIVKSRYFQPSDETTETKKSPLFENKNSSTSESNDDNNAADDAIIDDPNITDDVFIEVDTEDCDEGCSQFDDQEDKDYCIQVCGLNENNTPATQNCDDLEDLQKDYCWKDKAINEKNFDLCKKIVDKKLLETCKNRLTEEVINGSSGPIE